MEGDGGGAHPECGIGVLNGAEYEIVFFRGEEDKSRKMRE